MEQFKSNSNWTSSLTVVNHALQLTKAVALLPQFDSLSFDETVGLYYGLHGLYERLYTRIEKQLPKSWSITAHHFDSLSFDEAVGLVLYCRLYGHKERLYTVQELRGLSHRGSRRFSLTTTSWYAIKWSPSPSLLPPPSHTLIDIVYRLPHSKRRFDRSKDWQSHFYSYLQLQLETAIYVK